MEEPTSQGLSNLFLRKGFHDLKNKLDSGTSTYEEFAAMKMDEWKDEKVAGVLEGIQIYNYLHPEMKGFDN